MNSKKKGTDFELKIINELKTLGYKAGSTRNNNRALDSLGVDILDTSDYLFQCKKTERLGDLNKIIAKMPGDAPRVVIHAKNNRPTLVTMLWEDFKKKNL